LGDDPLTTLDTGCREPLRFDSPAGALFPLRVGLTGFTGLHPAVVRDKGAPAPTRNDPILRRLLGVPGPTPAID